MTHIPQIICGLLCTLGVFILYLIVLNFLALTDSSVLMQDESRSLGGEVAIDMDSRANPLQLQLIDEQVSVSQEFRKGLQSRLLLVAEGLRV